MVCHGNWLPWSPVFPELWEGFRVVSVEVYVSIFIWVFFVLRKDVEVEEKMEFKTRLGEYHY